MSSPLPTRQASFQARLMAPWAHQSLADPVVLDVDLILDVARYPKRFIQEPCSIVVVQGSSYLRDRDLMGALQESIEAIEFTERFPTEVAIAREIHSLCPRVLAAQAKRPHLIRRFAISRSRPIPGKSFAPGGELSVLALDRDDRLVVVTSGSDGGERRPLVIVVDIH